MHKRIEDALDKIDAAVFSGDTFHDSNDRQTLMLYMDRWSRELARIAVVHMENTSANLD